MVGSTAIVYRRVGTSNRRGLVSPVRRIEAGDKTVKYAILTVVNNDPFRSCFRTVSRGANDAPASPRPTLLAGKPDRPSQGIITIRRWYNVCRVAPRTSEGAFFSNVRVTFIARTIRLNHNFRDKFTKYYQRLLALPRTYAPNKQPTNSKCPGRNQITPIADKLKDRRRYNLNMISPFSSTENRNKIAFYNHK